MGQLYNYTGKVTKVYDGDTITVDINLGFNITFNKMKLRLARINAPEMRGVEKPLGIISRDYLAARVLHQYIKVKTIRDKKGKYGRYIAEIYDEDGVNLNDELVSNGLAVYREY